MLGKIRFLKRRYWLWRLKGPSFLKHKELIVGSIVLTMVLLVANFYFFSSQPVLLLADNQPIALVSGEKQVEEVLTSIKDDLVKEKNISISSLKTQLSYDKENINKYEQPVTNQKLYKLLIDCLDWQTESWAICINGQPSLYLASQEEANSALEKIKEYYLPTTNEQLTIENVCFEEDVEILPVTSSVESIKTVDMAVEVIAKGLNKIVEHAVQKGDSLWTIAQKANMSVNALKEINPELKGELLKPGQKLSLVKVEPLLRVSTVYTTTVKEDIPYKTQYETDSSLWRGQERVKKAGEQGSREVTYRLTQVNGQEVDKETLLEKIIIEPVSSIVVKGTKVMVASRGDGGSGRLGWPVRGRITSYYGMRGREFHSGIDIDGLRGDPIFAAEDGVVLSIQYLRTGYGKYIVIDHGRGLTTLYAHLNTINVSIGQKVTRGEIIGKMGSTGRSTGTHLHFEVRINGKHQNPLSFLER